MIVDFPTPLIPGKTKYLFVFFPSKNSSMYSIRLKYSGLWLNEILLGVISFFNELGFINT